MLAEEIHNRIAAAEFRPFSLALTNGERIRVQQRDAIALASTEIHGRRWYSTSLSVLEVDGDHAIEHVISLQRIASMVVDREDVGPN